MELTVDSAPTLLYPSDNTSSARDELAWRTGETLRRKIVDGARWTGGHYSYVNYAYGGETQEEMYGEENWARLNELKRVYDPENRFRYYAPVVQEVKGKQGRERDEL
jgi:FAD/FMN-containing dehydrogenase